MSNEQEFGRQLQDQTLACRLHIQKFGLSRALSKDQQRQTAEGFDAAAKMVYASKKILDAKHPRYKDVTRIIGEANKFWKGHTVPYPETGIRLIKKDKVEMFDEEMQARVESLNASVASLNEEYAAMRVEAQADLGDLFDTRDYPPTLLDEFSLSWDFPSVSPPEYLKQLNPELYQQQQQIIAARFNQAVGMCESAFMTQFSKMVDAIADRLAPDVDGKKKKFNDSLLGNLHEFFDQFSEMSLRSNEHLDELVERAKYVVSDITPAEVRGSDTLRENMQQSFQGIQEVLTGMMEDAPERRFELEE